MVPIVIIAYNNYTFVKSFVEQIRTLQTQLLLLTTIADIQNFTSITIH